MGKIADIIKETVKCYLCAGETIYNDERLEAEIRIIELITDIACYTINAMKIADEQFDTVSDFKDKFLENLAKLKGD